MGKSVHRCEVVVPAFVLPLIFTPFCFGQSTYTGNIGYTRHRKRTNKPNNTAEKTKQKQSRETGNIVYTRRRKTKQKQSRETGNIVYTRRRKTQQKQEKLAT